ncbi:MAG TPA: hypothetical protein VD816_16795, partial [Ohtaekwangia sp.]|nr:hypothetical protein [Ohtaekwangia sp.]
GVVFATAYSLRIMQRIFLGPLNDQPLNDLSMREKFILVPMTIAIIWLGFFPQPVLDTSRRPVEGLLLQHFPSGDPATTRNSVSVVTDEKGAHHE